MNRDIIYDSKEDMFSGSHSEDCRCKSCHKLLKQLFKRLSYSYRHRDYYKWIGPEDGQNPDGTRKGVEHFVYTWPWYDGLVDWVMIDVLDKDYTYNRAFGLRWHKVWILSKIF